MIPKIIHFIWAGGDKMMPEQALANVKSWTSANPDFKVLIWVDPITDLNVYEKYQNKLATLLEKNIQLADINQTDICTNEIRYELDSLWPNYGASSDMLRYNILYKMGGAYFDCMDVFPSPHFSLNDIRFSNQDKNAGVLVFDPTLKTPRLLLHITSHSVAMKGQETIGTEAIICSKNHPQMYKLAACAREAYHNNQWGYKMLKYQYDFFSTQEKRAMRKNSLEKKSTPINLHKHLLARHNSGNALFNSKTKSKEEMKIDQHEVIKRRAMNTLEATGPSMAIRCLQDDNMQIPAEYLMPHNKERTVDWVYLPPEHALSWVGMRVVPHDFDEALKIAVKSFIFEAEKMNMINLSGHVEKIVCSVINNEKMHHTIQTVTAEHVEALRKKAKEAMIKKLQEDERFQISIPTDQFSSPVISIFKKAS